MKKRSLGKMFLLEIVTLGIYRLYYFIKTRREMMNLNPNIKIMSPVFLFIPVIMVIAAFVILIAFIVLSNHNGSSSCTDSFSAYGSSQNLDTNNNGSSTQACSSTDSLVPIVIFYLALIAGFALLIVWEWSYAHGVEAVTGGKVSFALSLIILILVPDGIDILIIQDSFNKIGVDLGPGPSSTPGPGGLPQPYDYAAVPPGVPPVPPVPPANPEVPTTPPPPLPPTL